MQRAAILIDGGHLRDAVRRIGRTFSADFVELFAHRCLNPTDGALYRILYYDCPPYTGTHRKPITRDPVTYTRPEHAWVDLLAVREYFAVRQGKLQWRGWRLTREAAAGPLDRKLTDDDFEPDKRQKGVDMCFGLDIATLAHSSAVARVVLVAGDADFIPAIKYGRKLGLQIVLIEHPGNRTPAELRKHADLLRWVDWPAMSDRELGSAVAEQPAQIDDPPAVAPSPIGGTRYQSGRLIYGKVDRVERDKGWGFVICHDTNEHFYFKLSDVPEEAERAALARDMDVICELRKVAEGDKRGEVWKVRLGSEEVLIRG